MSFRTLILEKSNHVSLLRLNRPKVLNAINIKLLQELLEVLKKVNNDSSQRALVVTGVNRSSFAAGADINEMQNKSSNEAKKFSKLGHETFNFISKMHIPVIAAVDGFALGGGLELALACDFIYASKNSIFGLVEPSLGLIPGFGGIARLLRRVGIAKASEMIFSSEKLIAIDAFKYKLVNKIASDNVVKESMLCAEKISMQAPKSIIFCKKLLQFNSRMDLDVVNEMEQEYFSIIFSTADAKEGISAFISKQKPLFYGR